MTVFEGATLFWSLVALLVALGLGFVLPPLLRGGRREPGAGPAGVNEGVYRDQLAELDADLQAGALTRDQYQTARTELAERLALELHPEPAPAAGSTAGASRRVAWGVVVVLPSLALALYLTLGDREALVAPRAPSAVEIADPPPAVAPETAVDLPTLEGRVREKPDDGEGWLLLGREYVSLERPQDAVRAFEAAAARLPDDARVWSGYAEALGLVSGGLDGRPMETVYRALDLDSQDEKALELAGIYHYQHGNYGQAAYYWRYLSRLLPADSPFAREMAAAAADARSRARAAFEVEGAGSGVATPPATAGGGPR